MLPSSVGVEGLSGISTSTSASVSEMLVSVMLVASLPPMSKIKVRLFPRSAVGVLSTEKFADVFSVRA